VISTFDYKNIPPDTAFIKPRTKAISGPIRQGWREGKKTQQYALHSLKSDLTRWRPQATKIALANEKNPRRVTPAAVGSKSRRTLNYIRANSPSWPRSRDAFRQGMTEPAEGFST